VAIVTKIEALPQIKRRKRVAAYARVSDGKDAMRHSLSAQISYYNALIQRRIEWEFCGVYADDPVSGTQNNRSEFQRMLADCRAGKIDILITKSITRFARNTLVTLETVRELKALGIDVFFEKENIHSLSNDGELMLSILASYAQEESRSVSENCKWRIRKDFRAGKVSGMKMLGYRLNDGVLTIIPEEAALVQDIFSDYLSGMGIEAIMKKLRARGFPISKNGIAGILRNEKYQGDMCLQKSFISDHISKRKVKNTGQLPQFYVTESHEAIIDRETFTAVQAEISRRAALHQPRLRSPENDPLRRVWEESATGRFLTHPLTGLIKCGICGSPYKRKYAAAGTKYEKIVWICSTFNSLGKSACPSQQIPENILDAKTEEAGGFERLIEIRVPGSGKLKFIYEDREIDLTWSNPSRRHSWTEQMKQVARDRQNKIIEERRRNCDQ